MDRLAQGDRAAFPVVYDQLRAPVSRLCQRLMGDPTDAADAFQEAMQKIFERAPADYDRTRPALPWALALAAWECRTLKRKRFRRREELRGDAAGELAAPATGIHPSGGEDAATQRELEAAAREALGTLSPADQETLTATFWEEAPAVAGATFRKRRERALARLRVAFRRLYGLG